MHPSNVDRRGKAVCPQCETTVRTKPDESFGKRVRVIKEHAR